MQQVALISDIHGNVPALAAVLNDIQARGITRIICLGDLVGKGPQSDVCVDMCRDSSELVLRGNWDDFMPDPQTSPTLRWHQAQLGHERLHYLKQLPLAHDLVVSGRTVRLFHASQTSVHVRVLMSSGSEKHLAMFDNTDLTDPNGKGARADVVGYGDIHRAYQMSYDRRMLFKVGSVGNPLDGTTASYGILQGEFGDAEVSPFGIQLARVPYEIETAIQIAVEMDMPHLAAYEQELRTATYAGNLRV